MKTLMFAGILGLSAAKYANACNSGYAQCGGIGFQGDSCCDSGFTCVKINDWYSQCQPGAAEAAPAPAPPSNAVDQNQWGQNNQAPQGPPQWGQNNQAPQWGQNNQAPQWGQNNQAPQWGQNNQAPQGPPQWGQNNQAPQWGQNNQAPQGPPQWNQNQNQNNNNGFPTKQLPEQLPTKQLPEQSQQPQGPPAQPQQPAQPQGPPQAGGSMTAFNQNFFKNKIFVNPEYQEEVQSSIAKLNGELQEKAKKVLGVPTAVWLAWDGAPAQVPNYLKQAGSDTIVFMMYLIPTRDCNSLASAGGAGDIATYKKYVDSIYDAFKASPSSKIAIVIEPDTLGNLVTGNSEACKNNAGVHKESLAYAINKFGSLNNVAVYLDAAHNKWLGGNEAKAASIIKDILALAPQGKLRGFSTNVSNFQPINKEVQYHAALNAALEKEGITGMRFIVDTSRNGVDITEAFEKTKTWCNFVGTGFGERPTGSPAAGGLLDAYMWLKPPAESDGSSTGSRADPVCARPDSLPGAPDAGQWFHEYFVQLLKNANPTF